MNSAEKEAVLHCLRAMIDEELCEECPLYGTTGTDHCEKDCVRLAIEELEQDEYIKVPKKALKYRTARMVAYNVEWLKNHFDIERAVICGVQEPCDDATLKDIFCMGCEYKEQQPCDKCVYSTSEGCQYDDITEAIPPVSSSEKPNKSECEHDHEILKAYSDGASAVLDKIKAEMANHLQTMDICNVEKDNGVIVQSELTNRKVVLYDTVLQIIDKYKAEGSGEE